MFEALTQKLTDVFRRLSGKGKLSEKDIDEALREVRLALLEADVNFKVVKDFLAKVRERSIGAEVLESLTPAQQIIKIVAEELTSTLGKEASRLVPAPQSPSVIMLVGLQGSGKTTTAAKLGYHLKHSGQVPLLVAADTRRPAAIEQLTILGKQLNLPVYSEDPKNPPPDICARALKHARDTGTSWVIIDTQGRLHIDEDLMKELAEVKAKVNPSEVILVVDAMTGQDAVRVADEFNKRVALTGLILTKMDGDARGGAALSVKSVTGVPIKFTGVGEKADALEPFYPDRLASRILGMGDMLTLIEKAQKTFDEQKVKELEKKMKTSGGFDLEDLLWQFKEVKKMGSLAQIAEMMPGMGKFASQIDGEAGEKMLKRFEAIIQSMTPEERRNPSIIGGSRRKRIARGSGATTADVNQVLNQYQQVQKLTKFAAKGKLPKNLARMFGG
ncbi:MAG: signal recognition particle protein [Chloroflexota bacterium]